MNPQLKADWDLKPCCSAWMFWRCPTTHPSSVWFVFTRKQWIWVTRKFAAFGRVVSSAPWAQICGSSSLLTQKSVTNTQSFKQTFRCLDIWPELLTRIQRTVYSTLIKLSILVNNVCLCNAMLNVEWVTSSVWSKQMPIPGKECGAGDPFLRILHLDFQSW